MDFDEADIDFKHDYQDIWPLQPPKNPTTNRKEPTHESDGDKIANPWDDDDEKSSDSDDSNKETKTRNKTEFMLQVIQPVSAAFKAA